MDGSRRCSPQSQKLKDTCDMCSASKVRCNKEKPICSRCHKLSYPCFYSPARRIGRPHPPGKNSSKGKSRPAADPPERHPLNRHGEESGDLESNTSSVEAQNSQMCDVQANTIDNLQGSENDFNSDVVLDFRGSAASHAEAFPQTAHYVLPESHHTRRKDHMGEMDLFNFDYRVNRANSSEIDGLYCQTSLSNDTSTLLPTTSYHSSNTSSRRDHQSEVLAYEKDSASSASEHDCVTVAINMLQGLNMMSMGRPSSQTPAGETGAPTLDVLINTTSIAMKRVSTILVCPCSQKTDVGLLAAVVCATVLDIYGIILRNSSSSNNHCSSMDQPTYPSMSSVNDAMGDAKMMDIGTHLLQDGLSEEETIMQILDKLPKVANLVRQFSNRYSQDVVEGSAEFLPLLAGSLKSRLKSMTNVATNWLAHV